MVMLGAVAWTDGDPRQGKAGGGEA